MRRQTGRLRGTVRQADGCIALKEFEDKKPSWCDHSRKEFWSKKWKGLRDLGVRYIKSYDELLEESEKGLGIDEHKPKFDGLLEALQQACDVVPKMVFESALELSPLNDIILEASNRIRTIRRIRPLLNYGKPNACEVRVIDRNWLDFNQTHRNFPKPTFQTPTAGKEERISIRCRPRIEYTT